MGRRRAKVLAVLVAGLALAAMPSIASADWFLTKGRAVQLARYEAKQKYGAVDVDGNGVHYEASCRPQGEPYNPRYVYHRWVCGWADSSGCVGTLLILGSRISHSDFNYRVLRGQRCPT